MGAVGYTSGDPRKVDVAGDTMTGDLTLPGDPDQPLEAATKQYVDASGGGGGGGTPSNTVAAETSYGQASSAGAATAYSRGDHTHGTPALAGVAPSTTLGIGQSAAVGVAAVPARADHVHPTAGSATPSASAVGDSAAEGVAVGFARADHRHGREQFGSVTAATAFGESAANGSAAAVARSDHSHGTPALGTTGSTAAPGNHTHTVAVRRGYVTGGNTTIPDTGGVWEAIPGFELALPAAVGDYVDLSATFLYQPNAGFLDAAVIVGSTLVRFASSDAGTPAVEGDPGLYPLPATYRTTGGGGWGFQVTPDEQDGAVVRFVLAGMRSGGTGGTVFSSAAFPFRWHAINHGPAALA